MGKPWENGDLYGKSQLLMGKSRNHMVIFNSSVSLPEGSILYGGLLSHGVPPNHSLFVLGVP
jgi:hypothetical protein